MCGSGCHRCGETIVAFQHPRGCALPRTTLDKIRYSGLPVDVTDKLIALAEDEMLAKLGKQGLAEMRADDARDRAAREAIERGTGIAAERPDVFIFTAHPAPVIPAAHPRPGEPSMGERWGAFVTIGNVLDPQGSNAPLRTYLAETAGG